MRNRSGVFNRDDNWRFEFHAEGSESEVTRQVLSGIGARTEHGKRILRAAYQQGELSMVQRLRRDRHHEQATCWLHGSSFCLSRQPADKVRGL